MVQTHNDLARTIIEAFYARRTPVAGADLFRRDIAESSKAIQASRDLLERLRQRHRSEIVQTWEDADPAPVAVSAFDADVIRAVFRDLVREMKVPEPEWRDVARSLVSEYIECEQIDACLLDWITSK